MENTNTQDLSIDLSMFATSLKALRSALSREDIDHLLGYLRDANDRGKLSELLIHSQSIYSEGTDLAMAFHHAFYDVCLDPGEEF